MSAAKVNTAIKMLEALPEEAQDRVIEHLREYIADLGDEAKWDRAFAGTQKQLARAANRARREIAAGKAKPMDFCLNTRLA